MNNFFNNPEYAEYLKQYSGLQNLMPNNQNSLLMKKFSMQSGDNMNFNMPNFEEKITPSNIYAPYEGFIRGNMFPSLYNQYKLNKPYEIKPLNEQAQMLTYLDAICFAAHDLNLYLDNFPEDRDAIELFNTYRMELENVSNEYQNKYGPLFVNSNASNTYPWAWNNSPWPWENK